MQAGPAHEVARMGLDLIVTGCEGCRMQLRALTGREVLHPVQQAGAAVHCFRREYRKR